MAAKARRVKAKERGARKSGIVREGVRVSTDRV
jgi:hypothetical protein